jgi:hypothetical protein
MSVLTQNAFRPVQAITEKVGHFSASRQNSRGQRNPQPVDSEEARLRMLSRNGQFPISDRDGRSAAASRGKFPIRAPTDTLPHGAHTSSNPREPRPRPEPLANRGRRAARLPARDSPDPRPVRRRRRPEIWPTLRIIELGDHALGRDGALITSVHDVYRLQISRRPELAEQFKTGGRAREVDAAIGLRA